MSACACASSVASLPWALSILNSESLKPAASKAFFKYGASKFTYRTDDVVSGRMTPTSPEPALCRSFRVAITVKLTSNELTVSPDGTVAAGPDVLLLPHAAVMTAIAPTHAENERRLNFRKCRRNCRHHGRM